MIPWTHTTSRSLNSISMPSSYSLLNQHPAVSLVLLHFFGLYAVKFPFLLPQSWPLPSLTLRLAAQHPSPLAHLRDELMSVQMRETLTRAIRQTPMSIAFSGFNYRSSTPQCLQLMLMHQLPLLDKMPGSSPQPFPANPFLLHNSLVTLSGLPRVWRRLPSHPVLVPVF